MLGPRDGDRDHREEREMETLGYRGGKREGEEGGENAMREKGRNDLDRACMYAEGGGERV